MDLNLNIGNIQYIFSFIMIRVIVILSAFVRDSHVIFITIYSDMTGYTIFAWE